MILTSDVYIIGIMLIALLWIVCTLAKQGRGKTFRWCVELAYVIGVIGVTLFPLHYDMAGIASAIPDNYIPLRTIIDVLKSDSIKHICVQLVGNVLLAVPYGIWSEYYAPDKNSIVRAVLFPLVIEGSQYLMGCIIGYHYRSFDVDDVLLNTFGALIGMILYRQFKRHFSSHLRK